MPKRFIKDSCRTSKTLDRLSAEAERMFWRLVTVADDYGRFEAEIPLLASSCFPLRNGKMKIDHVAKWFSELCVDHVRLYSYKDKLFGYFVNWEESQGKARADKSRFPDPNHADARTCTQMHADSLVSESDLRIRDSISEVRSLAPASSRGFIEFWIQYPKKRSKGDAEKAWNALKPDEQLQDRIHDALERAKTSADWRKDGGQYIPYPATWLRAKGWEDEHRPAKDPLAEQAQFLMGRA
jgi:hypothetical protein